MLSTDPSIMLGFSGLDRFEARKKLWSDLEETGLAVKKEAYTLRVPRSQRGGEVILSLALHTEVLNIKDAPSTELLFLLLQNFFIIR